MKKIQSKKPTENSLEWRAHVRVRDTVAWRLPPLNSETVEGATINGKRVYSDKILSFGGKHCTSCLTFVETRNFSGTTLYKDHKVKSNSKEKEDSFLKPFRSPARGRRTNESKMEYKNPVSVFYCAKDSFQRFLDLSSCTTVEVKCTGSVLVPETSLESMIVKERTNAGLVSHLPFLSNANTSYFSNDIIVTEGILSNSESQNECPEITSDVNSQMFPACSTVLQHLVSFCMSKDAFLIIELNCFSQFTLSKICAFSFDVCFDRTLLESSPSNSSSSSYIKYPRITYPSYTVQLQAMSDTAAMLLCPMQAVTEDLLAGHQIVTTVTCCSKPKVCLLKSQMQRSQNIK